MPRYHQFLLGESRRTRRVRGKGRGNGLSSYTLSPSRIDGSWRTASSHVVIALSDPKTHVLALLGPVALAVTVAQATPSAEDPRAVVRVAARAVEGDMTPRLDARVRARVARTPTDRAAPLGLATLARLRYDSPA